MKDTGAVIVELGFVKNTKMIWSEVQAINADIDDKEMISESKTIYELIKRNYSI